MIIITEFEYLFRLLCKEPELGNHQATFQVTCS